MTRLEVVTQKEIDWLRGENERLKGIILEFETKSEKEKGELRGDNEAKSSATNIDKEDASHGSVVMRRLNSRQVDLLKLIAENESSPLDESQLTNLLKEKYGQSEIDVTDVRYNIGELLNHELIAFHIDGVERVYLPTHEGRKIVLAARNA